MIKEAYCSYEIAKLLKEKGFDEECFGAYTETNHNITMFTGLIKNSEYGNAMYTAPTHQMTCAWLREIYDLHIIAYPFKSGNDTSTKHYCCQVFKTFNLLGYEKYTNETLTSYEDAVESAIKYCLENLI